ncbi:hypothetical protein EV182_003039 [Spiromyces aspiralis]|uniref:Uncharacterized protein n=1 Tax=Spiromyces aspiralis TaxID=68401 RepID=A0ACC1HDL3_9FUNG|nr:hypothetical protein EV182_003039 [Spiromyces aspiralis]
MTNPILEQYTKGEPNLEGTINHLTKEQTELLRKFWARILAEFEKGIDELHEPEPLVDGQEASANANQDSDEEDDSSPATMTASAGAASSSPSPSPSQATSEKGSWSLFGFGKKKPSAASEQDPEYEQLVKDKVPKSHLPPPYFKQLQARTIHDAFWDSVMSDNPDTLVLRFLRARKWNVDHAFDMIMKCLKWRLNERIDKIQWYGESRINYRLICKGLGYVHGTDKIGQPVVYIPARLNNPKDQPLSHMLRYTIYLIEASRLMLEPPAEKACLVFDMQDLSMANMDWPFFKAFLRMLTDYYPECLGVVVVYKANRIFHVLFKMISGLLDPVVASKIRFANSTEDLLAYIDEDSLIAEFGGKDPYKFEYLPPREDEDKPMYDTDAILEARKRRSEAIEEYQKVTREWANLDVTGEQLDKVSQERDAARNKVIEASRPYAARVRAKTLYHRLDVV